MLAPIDGKHDFPPHGDQMEYADIVLYFLVTSIDILIIFIILELPIEPTVPIEEPTVKMRKHWLSKIVLMLDHLPARSFCDNKYHKMEKPWR